MASFCLATVSKKESKVSIDLASLQNLLTDVFCIEMNAVFHEVQAQIQEITQKGDRFQSAMKTATRAEEKNQIKQALLNVLREGENLKKMKDQIQELAKNPFQPPPTIVEVDAMINQEKVNRELQPNEIQLTLRGTPELAGCGASYVKYYLVYEEGQPPLMGHFQIKDAEKTYKHAFPP